MYLKKKGIKRVLLVQHYQRADGQQSRYGYKCSLPPVALTVLAIAYVIQVHRVFMLLPNSNSYENIMPKRKLHFILRMYNERSLIGEQGWRSGGSPRLSIPPMCGPGSNPGVDAIKGCVCCLFSPLLREIFLWVLRFSALIKKPKFPNSNLTMNGRGRTRMWMCSLKMIIYILIYWLIDLFTFATSCR